MKKIAILFMVFALVGVSAMAQEGLGVYVGAEVGISDFNDDPLPIIIRPYVGYEAALMDEAVEVVAELGVPILMVDGEMAIGIDLLLGGKYILSLSDASKLAFGLDAYIFFPVDEDKGMASTLSPAITANVMATELELWVVPNVKFTQTMGFGDLYFGVALPLIVVHAGDALDIILLEFTVGADLEAGIGVGATLCMDFSDGADALQGVRLFGSYTMDALFAKLSIDIPLVEDGIKFLGLTITPEVSYTLDMGLKLYAELPISGVASDGDIGVGLTVGAKFSF